MGSNVLAGDGGCGMWVDSSSWQGAGMIMRVLLTAVCLLLSAQPILSLKPMCTYRAMHPAVRPALLLATACLVHAGVWPLRGRGK